MRVASAGIGTMQSKDLTQPSRIPAEQLKPQATQIWYRSREWKRTVTQKTEDEDRVKNCAASPESSVPEGEPKQVDHVDEEEQNVPVFRTHMFRDKSQIEAILFSSRFGKRGRSKSALDSVKSEKSIESLPEKENTKPDGSEQSSEEYVGIDCSEPVPSVISGHPKPEGPDLNGDVAPSNKEAEHEDKRFVEQSGECPSTQTSVLCLFQF
ncbi:hypothetical protein FQA47_022710 [Oryzias melastigma]|uniref:Uncharacterized protein n=1 Tax=Oryzias melastigma TaxID=30732 RepID=A0A834FE93_ORYME|nr:hypothetical protein FQA47_022710 [Oryzias melastigma]